MKRIEILLNSGKDRYLLFATRQVRLKEYFYTDQDDVEGEFSSLLAFRKKIKLESRKKQGASD